MATTSETGTRFRKLRGALGWSGETPTCTRYCSKTRINCGKCKRISTTGGLLGKWPCWGRQLRMVALSRGVSCRRPNSPNIPICCLPTWMWWVRIRTRVSRRTTRTRAKRMETSNRSQVTPRKSWHQRSPSITKLQTGRIRDSKMICRSRASIRKESSRRKKRPICTSFSFRKSTRRSQNSIRSRSSTNLEKWPHLFQSSTSQTCRSSKRRRNVPMQF